jgi:hypothetical protein
MTDFALAERSDVCALIEGPKWADCEFYAAWLRAAAAAEALWGQALEDEQFKEHVMLLWCMVYPNFEIGAFTLLTRLEGQLSSFILPIGAGGDEVDVCIEIEFCLMLALGFFRLTGQRYQMTMPPRLTLERVKEAALTVARTEDGENGLCTQDLITTMPVSEARVWQTRLRSMDQSQRDADRLLLLDEPEGSR